MQVRLGRVSDWLPPAVGLLASACLSVAIPPPHPRTWLGLFAGSAASVGLMAGACAVAMFFVYVLLPPKEGVKPAILRTSAVAACMAPLVIFLEARSLWAVWIAAFWVWNIAFFFPSPKPANAFWKKFLIAVIASVLLQVGIGVAIGEQARLSTLLLGLSVVPILWRIRQERRMPGPLTPRQTVVVALLLAMFGLVHYLPIQFGSGEIAQAAGPGKGTKSNAAAAGFAVGGRFRGVILVPEPVEHTLLVPPLPMMGHDPFQAHKDPIGIPFYGVYWFFQFPDQGPNEDAYRTEGSPDKVTFKSVDMTPLVMEARQNLGRLIDVDACSGIDVAIRNADPYAGSIDMEVTIFNTSIPGHPRQRLGRAPVISKPGLGGPMLETVSFKMPELSSIRQFDELAIRFPRAQYRAGKSAKIAIERFFLMPRGR